MSTWRVALSIAVLSCAAFGCTTGLEITSSEMARHESEILRSRAVSHERSLEVLDAQIKTLDARIAEAEKEKQSAQGQFDAVKPKLAQTGRELGKATPTQRGYLEPEYDALKDRAEMLHARVGQFKNEIVFFEDQKSQFEAARRAKANMAEELNEEADHMTRRAQELEKKEQQERAKAQ